MSIYKNTGGLVTTCWLDLVTRFHNRAYIVIFAFLEWKLFLKRGICIESVLLFLIIKNSTLENGTTQLV